MLKRKKELSTCTSSESSSSKTSKPKKFKKNKAGVSKKKKSAAGDDLNKIRLANPDLFESSNTLKEESDHFIGQLKDFSSLVHSVRSTLEQVGQINDSERLRAMTAQNELKKIAEGGIAQQENQQLQILIKERQMELEVLKWNYKVTSLLKPNNQNVFSG
uniref:Uncharacterized protein n=1 Tax=Ditylenchus dipsaci TaxID=166011 RepID=A0A915D522_9BILA